MADQQTIDDLRLDLDVAIATMHAQAATINELVVRSLRQQGDAEEWLAIRDYIIAKFEGSRELSKIALRNHLTALVSDVRETLAEDTV